MVLLGFASKHRKEEPLALANLPASVLGHLNTIIMLLEAINKSARRYCSSLLVTLFIFAQTPLVAQTATPAGDPPDKEVADKEVLELSRFVVSASEDEGYRATNTLAGTRLKTDLKDIASSISVVTEEFLRDTASKNTEDLLLYTLGTEVGGPRGNFGGLGDGPTPSEAGALLRTNTVNRVRGLSAADNTRDFFLTDIPWDAYIVDRVDLQRGPNAILFGLGKPGGIINATTDQAIFRNSYSVQTRAGSYGSYRGAVDFNQVLLPKQLAVRFEALYDHTKYRQEPAYNRDGRYFGAIKYDPKWLAQRGMKTSLRVNYERGDIDANRPRTLPPGDRITPWFMTGTTTAPNGQVYQNFNRKVYDWRYYNSYFASIPDSGSNVTTSPNFNPYLGPILLFGGSYAFFGDPAASTQTGMLYVPQSLFTEHKGIGPTGATDGNVRGLLQGNRWGHIGNNVEIAQRLGLPFAAAYKNKVITDASIFDFYNKMVDGPNKNEARSFETFNATLSQTFWKDRLGYEAVFDKQTYADSSWALNLPGRGETAGFITINIDSVLPDGTPNPNVGRPMVVTRSEFGGDGIATEREVVRLTAYAELRADDFLKKSWLTKLLGRHVFTGAYTDDQSEREERVWSTYGLSDNGNGLLRSNNLLPDRGLQIVSYLGPDLRGVSSASGLNLSAITAVQSVPSANVLRGFDSTWNRPTSPSAPGYVNPAAAWVNPYNNGTLTQAENPANYVGWVDRPVTVLDSREDGNEDLLTRVASKNRDEVRSKVLVWQGYMFDGVVVPMFGYRKDEAKSYSVVAPTNATGGYADRASTNYAFATTPNNTISGTSKSYSVVVHTPKRLRQYLPKGSHVSLFYNKSSNFEPAAGRKDMYGRPIDPPSGETEDYGITISAFDERLSLRLNKYESTAQSASLGIGNAYMIGAQENRAWVAAKRLQAGLTGDPTYAGAVYNYGTTTNGIFVQTAADRALQQSHVDYVLKNLDYTTLAAWAVDVTDDTRWQLNQAERYVGPAGFTATTDTLSKGYEAELNFKPVPTWDIALNVAKTTAERTNIGGYLRAYIEQRNAVWNGLGGDIRQGPTNAASAVGISWNNLLYRPFLAQTLLEGSAVPEVRPWRANLATRYRFTKGKLRGVSIGGAYRWQDKVTIGYESVVQTISGVATETYDIQKPYYGPADEAIDLWAAYQRKIDKRVNWRIQLNVQNAFGSKELIPLNINPDGTYGAFRIREGVTWQLTNTFSF